MIQRTPNRAAFLDLLRILSFTCVLAGHKFYPDIAAIANDPNTHVTLKAVAQLAMFFCLGGGAGVVIFFLISGYIITHVLMQASTSTSHFVIKRIFRIYPLYVFAVLLEIALAHLVHGVPMVGLGTLISRLTLMGDFFGTPLALAGVEWTLRIEILFYALMAILKSTLWKHNQIRVLPICYLFIIAFLQIFGPFTQQGSFAYGYTTLYMPFLFLGSIILLLERSLINRNIGVFCILYIVISYLILLPKINPSFVHSHFMVTGCFLFMLAWVFREKFKTSALITLIANLSYAVYLFHGWLWDYLIQFIEYIHGKSAFMLFETTALLFICCYLAHVTIEKFGMRIGAHLARSKTRTETAPLLKATAS